MRQPNRLCTFTSGTMHVTPSSNVHASGLGESDAFESASASAQVGRAWNVGAAARSSAIHAPGSNGVTRVTRGRASAILCTAFLGFFDARRPPLRLGCYRMLDERLRTGDRT